MIHFYKRLKILKCRAVVVVDLINREVAAVVWPEATEAAAMPLLMTALTVWGDTAVLAVVMDKIILRTASEDLEGEVMAWGAPSVPWATPREVWV